MPNDDKIGTIVKDPDFQSLPLGDQQQFLSKVDPDFGKLKTGEFSTFLARYKGAAQTQMPDTIAQAKQVIQGLPARIDASQPNIQNEYQPMYGATNPAVQRAYATAAPRNIKMGSEIVGAAAGGGAIEGGGAVISTLRALASGSGAGIGNLVGTAGAGEQPSGKEALKTGAEFAAFDLGTAGAGAALGKAKTALTGVARRALRLGPELTEDAVKASVEDYGKAKAAYESSAQKVGTKNAQTVLDNEMKWADTQNKYKQAVADRESLLSANKEEVTQRASMERANIKDGAALGDNVQSTLKNVEGALTQKYEGVKQAIGNRPLEPEAVSKVFADAQEGIPLSEGDAKMVDSIVKSAMPQGGPFDAAMRSIQGEINPPVTTWGQAHELTKNLGRAIYGGSELPPNVARALVNTRNGMLDTLQMAADKAGVGTDFADTRHAWAEMEKTFRDTSAVSSGGSPLSRMVRAQDPGFVNAQLTGKAADRAIQLLEKYKNFGADPDLARGIIARTQAAKNLASRIKTIPEIKPPIRIDKPMKLTPQPPSGPEPVDPSTLKQGQLVAMQKTLNRPGPIEAGDVSKSGLTGRALDAMKKGLVKRVANKAMNNPEVFKELTKVTEGDTSALKRLGGTQ